MIMLGLISYFIFDLHALASWDALYWYIPAVFFLGAFALMGSYDGQKERRELRKAASRG